MTLGAKLRRAREQKGLKQVEVAERLKTTSQSISNYERDDRKPDIDTLQALAGVYEVKLEELLGKSRGLASAIPVDTNRIIELPVYGKVRAGAGGTALQEYLGTQP